MKATFALLANTEVHNLVRKLAWEFHQKYHTGTLSLPPHISLKQPFGIASLTQLEQYMDQFARSIAPFEVTLTKLDIVPVSFQGTDYGILWIDVQETDQLRRLHNRLNHELSQRFGPVPAEYDGDAYHFHMTIMLGGQPIEIYRRFYSELDTPNLNHSFTVRELAMFVYNEPLGPDNVYLCYKILPIGTSN